MTFADYVRVLRRSWALAVAVLLACLGASLAYVLTAAQRYQATAQIFVTTASADDASQLAQGNTFTQARVQSYTAIATVPAVTQPVIGELGLPMTPKQLAKAISADAVLNKVVINLHATDRSAQQAARIANAVAGRFSAVVEQLEQTATSSASPVKLTVTNPAAVPKHPVTPNIPLDLGLGVFGGLVLAAAAVAGRAVLGDDVTSPEDLEATVDGVPVMGCIVRDKTTSSQRLAVRSDRFGRRAEAYRQLRTNLQFVDVDSPPRVIAVCSSLPGEGKTTTALNLAAVIAEAGSRVCLVEADLRRPTMADTLGVVGEIGLTSVLIGAVPALAAVQTVGANFAVLPSGEIPPNPSELLATDRARSVLSELAGSFDYVIVDTAPLLSVADGSEVAALAEATVLVVRAGKTGRQQVREAVRRLARVGVRPVATVLNMASGGGLGEYYSGYRGYAPRSVPQHQAVG